MDKNNYYELKKPNIECFNVLGILCCLERHFFQDRNICLNNECFFFIILTCVVEYFSNMFFGIILLKFQVCWGVFSYFYNNKTIIFVQTEVKYLVTIKISLDFLIYNFTGFKAVIVYQTFIIIFIN